MTLFQCQIPSPTPDSIFWLLVLEFPIIFHFSLTVWCRPCILGDWSFPAICYVYIQLCIFWVCGWVASSQSSIEMEIVHLLGIYFFRSLFQVRFSLLLSIPLSRFSWFSRFMTSSNILYILRQFIIQVCETISYVFLLSIQAIARFSVSSCSLWGCVNQCRVALQYFLCIILFVAQGIIRDLLASYKFLRLFVC